MRIARRRAIDEPDVGLLFFHGPLLLCSFLLIHGLILRPPGGKAEQTKKWQKRVFSQGHVNSPTAAEMKVEAIPRCIDKDVALWLRYVPSAAVTSSVSRYSVSSSSLPPATRQTQQYVLLYGVLDLVVTRPRHSTTT